jgi:hypothetical protein
MIWLVLQLVHVGCGASGLQYNIIKPSRWSKLADGVELCVPIHSAYMPKSSDTPKNQQKTPTMRGEAGGRGGGVRGWWGMVGGGKGGGDVLHHRFQIHGIYSSGYLFLPFGHSCLWWLPPLPKLLGKLRERSLQLLAWAAKGGGSVCVGGWVGGWVGWVGCMLHGLNS